MNKEEIKKKALECGFKLKQQPDGNMDLNPYVYVFAHKLINKQGVKDSNGELDLIFKNLAYDVLSVAKSSLRRASRENDKVDAGSALIRAELKVRAYIKKWVMKNISYIIWLHIEDLLILDDFVGEKLNQLIENKARELLREVGEE